MKFHVFLRNVGTVEIEDVEDLAFDTEDGTANFYHYGDTLTIFPRENILFIKEMFDATPKSLN